ncbi:SNF1-interacting protein, variant 2 [Coniochaeta pulveracea]|uniref:SNF1-interacting protein, variant 2 n=1 Tax=Coniochaeta pulveracea TaxID=177199 RepID=A0A420Y572_9PEZI|nr:SNF1-interacting protein, variant 2 [Coniochaeta pulveracea]
MSALQIETLTGGYPQIERKLAPFWRGLNDFDDNWTEPQIIAVARGLPVPPPDQTPPDELVPRRPSTSESPFPTQNLNHLTVPMGRRTQSSASDRSAANASSSPPSHGRASSPFKPRGKALAAVLGGSSRNGSATDLVPREIMLPHDPFVNGQPLEVFLYKNATECPICFLTYPPYLNHTRCCDQPICSECFVQIKRPDPHYPEGHGDHENEANANPSSEEAAGQLVSEPACCPYCTQTDFGVTYEPPPFRRGLVYGSSPSNVGTMSTAMSSSSSINSSALSPTAGPPATGQGNRRRAQSLSANAPNVILTDKIRPDWFTKLQAARNHQARRAAAATALHTAAFLMGTNEAPAHRPFRVSRFGRRNTGGSGTATPSGLSASHSVVAGTGSGSGTPGHPGPEPGPRSSSGQGMLLPGSNVGGDGRSHMEHLEDMMLMEAIRLSLAAEEERTRKAEKEERKAAKKREKEEKKKAKAAAKHGNPYGASGHSSASGSNLSLPSLAFGRKRGNSGASNLRVEASLASAVASASSSGPGSPVAESTVSTHGKDKGKGIERGLPSTPEDSSEENAEDDTMTASTSTISAAAANSTTRPMPSPHQPVGPSHLRQMSSASSVTSSNPDSQPGSYTAPSHLQDPNASAVSLADREESDQDASASTEPMFNFRSLAEVVGVSLEGQNAGRRLSRIEAEQKAKVSADQSTDQGQSHNEDRTSKADEANEMPEVEHSEHVNAGDEAPTKPTIPLPASSDDRQDVPGFLAPPEVLITPETPALEEGVDESKQLGFQGTTVETIHQVAH